MSYGQQLTRMFLERLIASPVVEDFRPAWLFGMELDFYYETLSLAVEFNGDQHIVRTDFAGDPAAQIRRDWRKRQICAGRRVKVLTLEATDLEYSILRRKLGAKIGKSNLIPGKRCPEVNTLATAYRKTLIKSYDSVTARRKGYEPRKEAREKR